MMNLHVTTKKLNDSGNVFFKINVGDELMLYRAVYYNKVNITVIGYNEGAYGRNYTLYLLEKKAAKYYIICGVSNMPKRIIHWSREDLEKVLAAE